MRFNFGRILTRLRLTSHIHLLLIQGHKAEIIIVKRLKNVAKVRVEPRSCFKS